MRKLLPYLLCMLLLLGSFPLYAAANSSYSTVSSKNVVLEYPTAIEYFSQPLQATIKASRVNGSIYFMPVPEDNNGVLGTVANGTVVSILAERSGYYFFTTDDGRVGWNGTKFFTVTGTAATANTATQFTSTQGQSTVFYFGSGAVLAIPNSFTSTGTYRDRNNAYVNYYYTDFTQNMDLTLREISTYMYRQTGVDFLNALYESTKNSYPAPTYDNITADMCALSGYTGSDIYYFEAHLVDDILYSMEMLYPIVNRTVCDSMVVSITGSFSASSLPQNNFVTPSGTASYTSPYAIALNRNLNEGVYYSEEEKAGFVTETYYARKDSDGKRMSWYTSSAYDDPNTGYRIGLYYADGLLFFADAYHVGERSQVTFYFWGNRLLCCHDLRYGDSGLCFAGSNTYNNIVREFGDIYTKAAQNRK